MSPKSFYGARDPFSHKVFIDKGSQEGIAAGEAVVDDRGVIGQVTRVFPLQSEVTLISDKDQPVPVQVVRNGLRAVVFGAGEGLLELRFLSANADVQNGDVLVTSGLDGVFLPGLPVAKVVRVERDNVYAFARVLCQPAGGVDQYGLGAGTWAAASDAAARAHGTDQRGESGGQRQEGETPGMR